jgi:pimeloyl-ACP methyl ester carboxylesterase
MVLVSPASVLSLPPADEGMDRVRDYLSDEGKKQYDGFKKAYFDYGTIFSKSESELAELNAKYGGFFMDALKSSGAASVESKAASYRVGGWVVHAMYMSLGQKYDYTDLTRRISAPVLVIHGAGDLFPESASRRYADLISGAKFTVIQGASHFSFEEQPGEFARIVGDFLGESH